MLTNNWGLTERGFHRPLYGELLEGIEAKAREIFGAGINLTIRSPLGLFLRIFAWMLNLLFGTIENVYNSRFVDTAVGTSLVNLGRAIGMRLLAAAPAVGSLDISGEDGTTIPPGWLASRQDGVQYITLASGTIADGTVIIPARAISLGPIGNTAEDMITVIVNPNVIPGIEYVTNDAPFSGGRNTETDAEFRARYYASVDLPGGVNVDAIAAAIMNDVNGVYSAIGDENYTDAEDPVSGLPPHSFEIVVYGGTSEEVAQKIYALKPAGIQTFGNTTLQVFMANGRLTDISFSRPDTVNVWVKITDLVIDPQTFPSNGYDLIAQALVGFIGGDARGGLVVGQDVIFQRLPAVIFGSTSGIIDFHHFLSIDGVMFSVTNIEIGSRQKAIANTGSVIIS